MTEPLPLDTALARRRAAWLLALSLVLIVYASFWPFRFDGARLVAAIGGDPAELLPWGFSSRGDRIGNLLFYLPLGGCAAWLAPVRWHALAAAAATVVAALLLSLCVELLQHATSFRVPNRVDLVMNGIGAGIGASIGAWLRTRPWPFRMRILRHARPDPAALLIVGFWVAAHAAPFMPRLSVYKAWRALGPLREADPTLAGVIGFAAGYLVVAAAIRRLVVRASYFRVVALAVAASLAMRLVFVQQWLTADECIGLLLAAPLIAWLRHQPRARAFRITAGIVTVALLATLLAPPSQYWGDAVVLLDRAVLIVGALWMADQAALPLLPATAVLALAAAAAGGFTVAPLVVLAGVLVHVGSVLHEPWPAARERA